MQRLRAEVRRRVVPGAAPGAARPIRATCRPSRAGAEDFTWQGPALRPAGRRRSTGCRRACGSRAWPRKSKRLHARTAPAAGWSEAGGSRTRLALEFASTDLAAASRALGYRDVVDAEQARVERQPDLERRPGRGRARAHGRHRCASSSSDGQLRGVEPGAGRMLGLLSVTDLPRRLALDFRDVTEEGLAFDTVRGDFEMRAGNAYTQNLLLKGAAVDVGVVGRTGLATQDYDQTMVVSGNPSGPITVAGALAGGPVGAAGALLISQLFKGQLQGLARVYYRVTRPVGRSHGRAHLGVSRQRSSRPAAVARRGGAGT
ncbi:MAG: hypothetical protein MZV65_38135 [Chromatiales bacterium]|nr:hypothetical protein [Chromatiales bacterium]